ncbi:T/G mismatch-specific endonuclease [Blastococcus aurantiacus]|uniref:T/G mismatch-specific endonuclease n=1 Tax=Blastococcus aurantiacus TaxID=1550231 RepID=A0A1G7PN38_9ACTN|nr:T/G mismatch-specific endonuclease [Blastococcus aurantiacus]
MFRARDVVHDSLLTHDALRSQAWRRLYRGVYADADLPDSLDVRIRGARLISPSTAVFSGRTAAHLHGAPELADRRGLPVEVTVPAGVRFGPVRGLQVRRVDLPVSDVARVGEWRCTTGLRTALDIARWDPLPDAVAALDLLLARGVVAEVALREPAASRDGRGSRQARRAVELSDARAESQPESRLRVILTLAGLPPVPQCVVRGQGGEFLARVDLGYPELRVAVEYDGAWHAGNGQFVRDRRRLNLLTAAGWAVLHVTSADLRDTALLVERVRALLRRATTGK